MLDVISFLIILPSGLFSISFIPTISIKYLKTCLKTLFVAILFGVISGMEIRHFKSILGTLLEEGRGIVS